MVHLRESKKNKRSATVIAMQLSWPVSPYFVSLVFFPCYSPALIPSTIQVFQHISFLIPVLQKENKQAKKTPPNNLIVFCIDLKI